MSFAFNALYQAALGLVYPSLPLYLYLKGVNVVTISLVVSALGAGSLLGSTASGALYDRARNKAALYLIEGALTLASLIALAMPLGIYGLAASALAFSAFSSSLYPVIMSNLIHKGAERAVGLFWAGGSLGWALGTGVAGELLSIGPWALFASASAVLSAAIAVGLYIRAEAQQPQSVEGGSAHLVVIYAAAALIVFSIDIVKNMYLPSFYVYIGVPEQLSTVTLSVEALLEIPAILYFARLIERRGARFVLAISLALSSAFVAVNSLVRNTVEAFVAMASYCLVWGSFSVSSSLLFAEVGGRRRGLAFGAYGALYSIAGIITPLYLGPMIAAWGYRVSFKVVALPPLVILALLALIRNKKSI
nr:MAG: hypothetical protein TU35_06960 [Thermoproteus sp. AZ2]